MAERKGGEEHDGRKSTLDIRRGFLGHLRDIEDNLKLYGFNIHGN